MVSSAVTGTTWTLLTKLNSIFTAVEIFAFTIPTEGAAPELHGLNA